MGNLCTQGNYDEVGTEAKRPEESIDTMAPRDSTTGFQLIRPMVTRSRCSTQLELILVMCGSQNERLIVPRDEVRRICKKHREFKQKINGIVRGLRDVNKILMEAPHDGSTEWTIVNGEFEILKQGAQDIAIHDFNTILCELKNYISKTWESNETNLFEETIVKMHISPPSPKVALLNTLPTLQVVEEDLNVMSQSVARTDEDSVKPDTNVVVEDEMHKRSISWGLPTWAPFFRLDPQPECPQVDSFDHQEQCSHVSVSA